MLRLSCVLFVSSLPLAAQHAAALFDAPVAQLPEDSSPFQRLFDFDGDGDKDAVGSRVFGDGLQYQVQVWRNDQGRYVQHFSDVKPLTGGHKANMSVATGDLDGDTDQDFVAGDGLLVATYSNDGQGQFTRTTFPVTQKVSDLAIGDFDGDGSNDLVVYCRDPATALPGFLLLRRAAGGQSTVPVPASLIMYSRIEVLALDSDKAQELGLWYDTLNQFHSYDWVNGNLVALPPISAAVTVSSRWSFWTSGDLDADGDVDVVAFELPTQNDAPRVHCFRNTGTGTLVADAPYVGGPAEFLADIDGDGDLDGVCCGGGGGRPPTWPRVDFGSWFEISINTGQGVFARSFGFPGKGSRRMAGATDVDGDGKMDLVAGACVYYGGESLTARNVQIGTDAVLSGGLFDPSRTRSHLGDQDRDGDPDFLLGVEYRGANDGDGAIRRIQPAQSAIPLGMTVGVPQYQGDYDGDGAPDLLVPLLQAGPGQVFSHMGLLRNNGSGELLYAGMAAPPSQRIGWQANTWITGTNNGFTADVDGDGDIDVVAVSDAAYEGQARTEIWLNQGSGQFVAGALLSGERIEVVADFDGDSIPDCITRSNYPGVLRLRLGTGVPATPFGAPLALFPGLVLDLYPDSVQVVEANGDARRDVLVKTYSSEPFASGFALYCNTTTGPGAPAFGRASLAVARVSYGLASASVFDVDGDGREDLVVMSPEGANYIARIWRRTGGDGQVLQTQHFAAPIDQVIWTGFPADADGDGDLDLVGSVVVRNQLYRGATAGARRQYGTGTAGEAGITPLLGATGPFRVSGTNVLRLSGITGPTIGVLVIGAQAADLPDFPLPGLRCLVDPAVLVTVPWQLPAAGGGSASGRAQLTLPIPAGIQGVEVYEQVFLLDAAAASGVAASNGLFLRVGG